MERWSGSEQVREASQAERWAGIRAQKRGDDPPKVVVVVVVVRAVRKVRLRMTVVGGVGGVMMVMRAVRKVWVRVAVG